MQNTIENGLLTADELCAKLGRTRRTLARWTERGIAPPVVAVGRLRLYRIEAVQEWLKQHERRHRANKAN